ncbi:MAG: hypothetical protein HND43_11055 [Armatimonadetes bacterium]|nr:hypothetical protein [Rhodocyclaceae bacterium]MCL4682443.1 hypothetical protein [Rhodocyclaceae bacterium]NOG39908.1 hypothetical protein [Armatimonadota bacterium]
MNPERLLKLAAEHYRVLDEVARRGLSSFTAVQFREVLRLRAPEETRGADQVLSQLKDAGLVEHSPDSEAYFELVAQVEEFIRYLSQRQRVTSPGALMPMIEELEFHTDELRRAIDDRDASAGGLLFETARNRLPGIIEGIRSLCQDNRKAIENEVMSIKSREDNRTTRQRYNVIHMLYTRNIEPMRTVIDVGGPMDKALSRLLDVTRHGLDVLASDYHAPDLLTGLRRRVARLRRDAYEHFTASLKDILPLYQKLRKDSAFAAAANKVLDAVGREGAASLPFRETIPIARWRAESLFSARSLLEYLEGLFADSRLEPEPLVLPGDEDETTARLLDPIEVEERLSEEMPQPDLLAWLFARYGDYPEGQILAVYNNISRSEMYLRDYAGDRETRDFALAIYTYHPLRIDHAPR